MSTGGYASLSADLLGGLALASLIVDLKCKPCGWLPVLVVLMAETAYSGGLIRHPEICMNTAYCYDEKKREMHQSGIYCAV
jgi:hypothetical protein